MFSRSSSGGEGRGEEASGRHYCAVLLGLPAEDGDAVALHCKGFANMIKLSINGQPVAVPPGTIVAAAIALAGVVRFRRSVSGQPRGPLCGMGTCMECRVTINGEPHRRSCQTLCTEGMEVRTDD